jgi:hypothetical protein
VLRIMAPALTAKLSTGLVLDVKHATIDLDEQRAPYVDLQLLCASPNGSQLETIDPRAGQRVLVQLDDRASLFGGTSEQRTFDVALDGRETGAAGGELQLRLYSDEVQLIRKGLLLNNVKDWGTTSARQLVSLVLTSLGYSLAPGIDDAIIDPAAAVQSPGQSYWDFLAGTLEGANLRLWCDELRVWRLNDKSLIAPGQLSLAYGGTITSLNDSIGLDQEYADAVVVKYSYETDAGNAETAYEAWPPGATDAQRVVVIPFSTRPAVDGAARRLLKRLQGRGRVLSTEAVARYRVVPTQSFLATLPDGAPVQTGLVSGVVWSFPEDRMVIRSRELTDTSTTAWAAQPEGRSWASVPAGVSWLTVDAIAWTRGPAGASWDDVPPGYRWDEMGDYING